MSFKERKLIVGDDREFPSLSGAPQAQQNTSAQQMWSNPTIRTNQQQTIQRPQGQGQAPQQGQASQTANQQLQSQSQDDSSQSQFSGAGDDYRFGGAGGVGQLGGGAQPQTGNIEEFPPLGGAAGEIGPDRRAGLIQNAAAFGSNAGAGAFPGLGQTRNGLPSPTDSQQDRTLNPTVGGRGLPGAGKQSGFDDANQSLTELVSRAPFDNLRQTQSNLQEVCDMRNDTVRNLTEFQAGQRTGQAPGNLGFLGPQIGIRTGGDIAPVGQRPQQNQFEQTFGAESIGSPNGQTLLHKKLADMTDSERYGLPGLLSMIPMESPDYSSLAMGQDLTVLGLDLSRPE